jgi:phytoene dehydrogenase-like protein
MGLNDTGVIIVGAGLAGLSCARYLTAQGVPLVVLEAAGRIGGRLKTDTYKGFLLNHGFQVLQTAYTEPQRWLDFDRLDLKPFAPGAIVRLNGKFYRISDPLRQPRDMIDTLKAPIGSFMDRLRLVRMTIAACRSTVSNIFAQPDMTTIEYLHRQGFSEKMIHCFFRPFFAGVCLDEDLQASSRVLRYVLRLFAQGDVALPRRGMGAIAQELGGGLPPQCLHTETKVESIHSGGVVLTSGQEIQCRAVVLATHGPETARLLGKTDSISSHAEICLYFAAKKAPIKAPFLVLNGEGDGVINSLTVPSIVADSYAPAGQALISVVVLGEGINTPALEETVKQELIGWFGPAVDNWRHLKTYRIAHALPAQPPPCPDPTVPAARVKPGVYMCGEYGSIPGIQWAMLSGRYAAEAILSDLNPS